VISVLPGAVEFVREWRRRKGPPKGPDEPALA
jgi:hypothetical protein